MYGYSESYRRKLLRERNIKERKEKIMPRGFSFSPLIRTDEKDSFLGSEEKVQKCLSETFESTIKLKSRLGAVFVEITKPDGGVIQDILRKDNIDYNYCVNLIKLALGVKKDGE